MEHNLKKDIGDNKVCTGFKMLEVKVPTVLFFPARRVFRYAGMDVTISFIDGGQDS